METRETYLEKANNCKQQEQWEKAIASYQTVLEMKPDDWEARHHLGDCLLNIERWQDAATSYRQALELNPNFIWSFHNLGVALVNLAQFEEAHDCFEKVRAIKEDFWELHQLDFSVQQKLGDYLFEQQRWQDAVTVYRRVISLNPDFVWGHVNLGRALQELGQLEEAVSVLRRAIEIEPNFVEYIDLSQYQRVLELIETLLSSDNQNIWAYYAAAQLLKKEGRIQEALEKCEQGLSISSEDTNLQNIQKLIEEKLYLDNCLNLSPEKIQENPLFNSAFYHEQVKQNKPELLEKLATTDYLTHYFEFGAFAGLSCHPLIDEIYCREQMGNQEGYIALKHILIEENLKFKPHPLFDPTFYAGQCDRQFSTVGFALIHYLSNSNKGDYLARKEHPISIENPCPNHFFDTDFYELQVYECFSKQVTPLEDYIKYRKANPSKKFLNKVYTLKNIDLIQKSEPPLNHYLNKSPLQDSLFDWSEAVVTKPKPENLGDYAFIQMTPNRTRNPYFTMIPNAFLKAQWDFRYSHNLGDMVKYAQVKKRKELAFWFHQFDPFYHSKNNNLAESRKSARQLIENLQKIKNEGCKIIHTWHNPVPHNRNYLEADYYLYLTLNNLLDLIFVHCDQGRDWISKFCPNVPIKVIKHPSFNCQYNTFIDKKVARDLLKIDHNSFLFLSIGEMKPYKNLSLLQQAWEKFQNKAGNNEAHLILAGKFPEDSQDLTLLSQTQNVLTVDKHLSDHELSLYIAAADVCVFTHREIWVSGGVLTAMSFGCPVIVPSNTGLTDYVLDNNNGLIFENGNCESLVEALENIKASPFKEHMKFMNRAWGEENTSFSLQPQYAECIIKTCAN